MTKNKKGLNPAQVQAPQSAQHDRSIATSHQPAKAAAKKERAFMLILSSSGGVTENDILRHCHLSSGRNYPTLLERTLSIRLHRDDILNPDGIDTHYRYRITNRADAERVADLIDNMRQRRKAPPLSAQELAALLACYPEQTATTA
ncbi:hypothetical protein [Zobellella maritima]|uniref:hypothetical protein n=1 Tax=Zobellella maritima TaxID=2059725 RepID=UPI000E30502E|nr:hypothetical protein [Zobellella maritima]